MIAPRRLPPLVRQYIDFPQIELEWRDEFQRKKWNKLASAAKKLRKRRAWLAIHNPDGTLKPLHRSEGKPGTARG